MENKNNLTGHCTFNDTIYINEQYIKFAHLTKSFHKAPCCSVTWPRRKQSLRGDRSLSYRPSASASPGSNQYSIYRYPCHKHIVGCSKTSRFEFPGSVLTMLTSSVRSCFLTDPASAGSRPELPFRLCIVVPLLFCLHYLLLSLQQVNNQVCQN